MSEYAQMRLGLVVASLTLVAVSLAAVGIESYERERSGREREQAAVATPLLTAAAATPAPRPALRCANGDPPRAWSQIELEGQIHLAIMARDTAMANTWNATAEKWVRIGELTMRIVRECRGGSRD